MLSLSLVGSILIGCLSLVKAQSLRRNNMDFGVFNGHLVGIDDIDKPNYKDLRGFLGVNQLPVIRPQGGIIGGGIPTAGVVGPITTRKLRRCQKNTCQKLKITANCKYTPILQDLSGQYCRGCEQDVCLDIAVRKQGLNSLNGVKGQRAGNKDERKRLRKLRRRICRSTGVCPGESRQEVTQQQLKRTLLGGAGGGRGVVGGGRGIMGGGRGIMGGGRGIMGGGRGIVGGGRGIMGGGRGIMGGGRGIMGGQTPIGVVAGQPPIGILAGSPSIGMMAGQPPIRPIGVMGGQAPIGIVGGQRPILSELLGNILGNTQMQMLGV